MKRFTLITLCLLFGALISPCWAVEVSVFGPEDYSKVGHGPTVYTESLTINGLSGPAKLVITNHGDRWWKRVRFAKIWLNGQVIYKIRDFKGFPKALKKVVNLQETNEIKVKLWGVRGKRLSVEVIREEAPGTAVIGPEGGVFDFPNVVRLDIPAGAVNEKTVIKISNLPCEDVEVILAARDFTSHNKRCIGGFVANPNLKFDVPITAILPIAPLDPIEIPIPIEVDLDEQKYWFPKMSLRYQDNRNMVEMEIQSFSGKGVVALKDRYEVLCTDPYWRDKFGPDCVVKLKELDEVLCTDPFWNVLRPECEELDCLQPAYCLLAEEDRPENWICCREFGGELILEEGDTTPLDECQLVGEEMIVNYPFCPSSPPESNCPNPQRRVIGETSPGCPEGITFQVKITPENPQIYVCEEASLKAEITGSDEDGNTVIPTQEMPTIWDFDPPNTEVAEFTYLGPFGESKILGLKAGLVSVIAYSPDPDEFGATILEVMKPELDIITEDGDFRMDVGDEETWDALCLTCPNGEVVWDTDRPDVVELLGLVSDAVRVKALSKGTALVRANFICGVPDPVVYSASVSVELEVGSVEIQPNARTISVNETLPLNIIVRDKNGILLGGCPSPISWTIPPGGIIAFDPINQIVTGVSEGGVVTITAECEGESGSAEIQVEGHILDGLWLEDKIVVTSGNCGIGAEDFNLTVEGDTIWLQGCRGTLTDHSFSCYHPGVLYSSTGTFADDWKSYTGTSAAYDGTGNVVCTWIVEGSKLSP